MVFSKEQEILTTIIKDRKFKDIPAWMLCSLDDAGFSFLVEHVLYVIDQMSPLTITEGVDDDLLCRMQSVLLRIKHIGNISDATIYNCLYHTYPNQTILGASFLLETNAEWKRLVRKNTDVTAYASYSLFFKMDAVMALSFHYRFHKHEMLPTLVNLLLCNLNNQLIRNNICADDLIPSFLEAILCKRKTLHVSSEFYVMLWDAIWKHRHTYIWIKCYFTPEQLWGGGVLYYPYQDRDWVYSFLYHVHNYLETADSFDKLPQTIYPYLKEIAEDPYYEDQHKLHMFHWIYDMVKKNANNLPFLCPFQCIFTTSAYDVYVSKFSFSSTIPLENYMDYHVFAGIRATNHLLQTMFIEAGGNPCTLLYMKSYSVVYTIGGICCAIDHSKPEHIVELVTNKMVQQILMEEYVGQGYTPERTNKLLNALGKYPDTANMELYYWVRSNLVVLDSIQAHTNTIVCRILPLSFEEVFQILSKCPDSLVHVPCGLVDFYQMLRILNQKKRYVPLYYGYLFVNGGLFKSKLGIENYLDINKLGDLIYDFPAYLGDVQDDITGILLLELLCLPK